MLPIAIIGYGKIARDQHVPAIRADARFRLTGAIDPHAPPGDLPIHPDLAALTAAGLAPAAVAICTPPFARAGVAHDAIAAGLHVLLEKPPGLTVGQVTELEAQARNAGVTLFTAWHSQEAAGVDAAREWLADRTIEAVRVAWMEDIRVWHPGQEWILEAGGFGVFDPAINALSILTDILPAPLSVESAALSIPAGRSQPIAGSLALRSGNVPVSVELDFLHEGVQRWDIEVDTPDGMLKLAMGGAELTIAGESVEMGRNVEYPRLYARFAELVARGESDVDLAPLRLVTEALEIGKRHQVEAFSFT